MLHPPTLKDSTSSLRADLTHHTGTHVQDQLFWSRPYVQCQMIYAISWPHTDPHVMRTMPAHLTSTRPMIQQMLALVPNVCRIYTACTRAKRTCILAVVQILFLKFPTQLLRFSIFSKFCFKTLCGILFPIFPQKLILFIMFFLQIW